MNKVTFEIFEKVFNKLEGEPEITLYINNDKYMIIKYSDHVSFQKIGTGSEIDYNNLKDLYESELKNEWVNIKDIIIDDTFSLKDDLDYILSGDYIKI